MTNEKIAFPSKSSALSAKSLIARFDSTIEQAGTLRDQIQKDLLSAGLHAYHHGNYTHVNHLILNIGQGVKHDLMVKWCTKYLGYTISEGSKEFDGWNGKGHIKDNWDAAKDNKWYTPDNDNPFEMYDDEKRTLAFIKSHLKGLKANKSALEASGKSEIEVKRETSNMTASTMALLFNLIDIDKLEINEEHGTAAVKVAA